MPLDLFVDLLLAALAAAMVLAGVWVFRGPTVADSAIAADLIFFGLIGFVGLIGLRMDIPFVFDIILIATVLGFLSALSMARLVQGGKR